MTSRSLIDRFKQSTMPSRSPILPMHNPNTKRSASQYSMEELDPWPEDDDEVFRDKASPNSRSRKKDVPAPSLPRSPSPDVWRDETSSAGSPYGRRSRAMFAGPPPPIAASVAFGKASSRAGSNRSTDRNGAGQQAYARQSGLGSLIFDYQREKSTPHQQDSIWRGIQRREKALEKEVQQYLDLQAGGLVAGSNGMPPLGSDLGEYSDTGSSTPTGTFYSTATSKSRMVNSLHIPTRSNAEGNVIPVRQPKSNKPRGLRSARLGLRKSISALAQLKAEEDSHIDDALAERGKALNHLNRLSMRRENASTELKTLEEDEEEPLGQKLRELGTEYDTVTQEIRELEERLVGMRNHRRSLRRNMEDVQNRREAGLSGYRGALKDVDSEVSNLMHRPPVQPLDLFLLQDGPGQPASSEGTEFLRLIPERRTVDMAKAWWEGEIALLEKRKAQTEADKDALLEGGATWAEVMQLVSDYESRLRQIMKGDHPPTSAKGKDKAVSQEELIREQLPEMDKVVQELEKHQQLAEDRNWNLLICAIGAELEAFAEAQQMLCGFLEEDGASQDVSQATDDPGHNQHDGHDESSDNEVPPDLLVSRVDSATSVPPPPDSPHVEPDLTRIESNNEVPEEFLAEHKDKSD